MVVPDYGVHGFCLGGGTELALACDYRVAMDDDRTRFGQPEVRLGKLPELLFYGAQRRYFLKNYFMVM